MSDSQRPSVNFGGGMTLPSAVFVVFLTLKLCGIEPVASWSWWWVTCPLWLGLALVTIILALIAGVVGLIALIGAWVNRN